MTLSTNLVYTSCNAPAPPMQNTLAKRSASLQLAGRSTKEPQPLEIGTTQGLPNTRRAAQRLSIGIVIASMTNKNKRKLTYDLKVREALEIRLHHRGPGHGLNEDLGAYVKTNMWNPVFHQLGDDDGGGREGLGSSPVAGFFPL